MKKVENFDPAMCCSTGVCGPSLDPELIGIKIDLNTTINANSNRKIIVPF